MAHFVTQGDDRQVCFSAVVVSASTVANGDLCTFDTTSGDVKAFDGTEADRRAGWHFGDSVTGDGTESGPRAKINPGGFILRNITITGLGGTPQDDYGDPVYMSDNNTYTLTSTGNVLVGYVLPNRDGCDAVTKANIQTINVFGTTG